MNLEDVKDLVKVLIITSRGRYSIHDLLRDFRIEAGIPLPLFGYANAREFLMSLSDTIKLEGPGRKWLRVVDISRSAHIVALVGRERRRPRRSGPTFKYSQLQPEEMGNPSGITVPLGRGRKRKYPGSYELGIVYSKVDIESPEAQAARAARERQADPNASPRDDNGRDLNEIQPIASTSSDYSYPEPAYLVPEDVRNKLGVLMKAQTKGIWCRDLSDIYYDYFDEPLDFTKYGYRSLIQMVKEMKDTFRYIRRGIGDWLLFDASRPVSVEEDEIRNRDDPILPLDIEGRILGILQRFFERPRNHVLQGSALLALYNEKYNKELKYDEFGFPSLKSMLESLNTTIVIEEDADGNLLIKPPSQRNTSEDEADIVLTPEDEMFFELFPSDFAGYGEEFAHIDLDDYFEVNTTTRVNIADVWSPYKFFVQLKPFEIEFNNMMRDMREFYNENQNKFKMPQATILPDQICVVAYEINRSREWHRALITEVPDRDHAVVFFVDFGMKVTVEANNMRFLHRDFTHLPAQCFAVKLHKVKPVDGGDWSKPVCQRFLRMTCSGPTSILVTELDHENFTVIGELFCGRGDEKINVNSQLVNEGLAAISTDTTSSEDSMDSDDETSAAEGPGMEASTTRTFTRPTSTPTVSTPGTFSTGTFTPPPPAPGNFSGGNSAMETYAIDAFDEGPYVDDSIILEPLTDEDSAEEID